MESERGQPVVPAVEASREEAAVSSEGAKKKKCKCKKVKPSKGCVIRILIGVFLLGFVVYLIVDFNRVRQGFIDFINWVGMCQLQFQNNLALGIFLLILIYVVATVLFVPGLLLTIGAGAAIEAALNSVWRKTVLLTSEAILLGSFAVWIGAQLGSFVAMLLGRYLLRSAVQKKALKYRVFRAIDNALKHEGFKFTVLLRLCPLIPFAFLNYAFGLTSVSIKNYVLGKLRFKAGGIGMIPGTVAYVYLGTTISSIADASMGGLRGGGVELGLIIGGSVLAIVAVVLVTIRAKRELNKLIKKEKEEEEERKKKQEEEERNEVETNKALEEAIQNQACNEEKVQEDQKSKHAKEDSYAGLMPGQAELPKQKE